MFCGFRLLHSELYLKTVAWQSGEAEPCCKTMLTSDRWDGSFGKKRKIGSIFQPSLSVTNVDGWQSILSVCSADTEFILYDTVGSNCLDFCGGGRLFQLQLEPLPAQQEQLQLPLEFQFSWKNITCCDALFLPQGRGPNGEKSASLIFLQGLTIFLTGGRKGQEKPSFPASKFFKIVAVGCPFTRPRTVKQWKNPEMDILILNGEVSEMGRQLLSGSLRMNKNDIRKVKEEVRLYLFGGEKQCME